MNLRLSFGDINIIIAEMEGWINVDGKFTKEDVIAYLEQKIINDMYSDAEYGMYISWKSKGEINESIYKKLYEEMLIEYEGVD